MEIQTYPLGELQANCYVIIKDSHCVLIDPGDSADFLLEKILQKRLILDAILLTHGHFDHCMAVGEIQLSFPVPVYMNIKDEFLIDRLQDTAEHFLSYTPVIIHPQKIKNIAKGRQKIGAFSFEVINTPGHTPGSVCYFFPEENTLFTGDTLFQNGIGRYDHAYSSKKDLFKSLNTLFQLSEETILYPGHGEMTTIGEEKALTNV